MEEKGTKQYNVECPFYRFDDGKGLIRCEGLVEKSSINLKYRKKQDFAIQLQTFCCQHFRKCEIYRVLMETYDAL